MNDARKEWQAQERARTVSGTAVSGDALVDRYRAVYRGVAMAPLPVPPADLGAHILDRIRREEREERFERWALRVIAIAGGIGIALYAGPALLESLGPALPGGDLAREIARFATNPWLWSTLAAMATALACDRRAAPKAD